MSLFHMGQYITGNETLASFPPTMTDSPSITVFTKAAVAGVSLYDVDRHNDDQMREELGKIKGARLK
jgi:hypothetical protein